MADPDGTRRIGIKQRLIANVRHGARIPTVDDRQPWLPNPGHRLHDTQSATLPEKVEYAIIGSGIAGCSVAWNLLTQDGFEHTVAVLEARGLASGATGRSGGQVRLMAVHEFADMSARRGILSAFAFNRFAAESYYRLVELVREDPLATDYHFAPVNGVTNLVDRADIVRVNHHVGAFEEACALRWSPGEVRPPEYSSSHYRFLNTRGAIEQPGLVVLPYRLVTGLFERLLQMYPTQLSIQTHTPVHHVGYNRCLASHKYTLTTSRGRVRANHVIHCTNGWTSSLLPELAEKIFPWRTTMAYHEFDYDPQTLPGHVGPPQYIWQEVSRPRHDYTSNTVVMGKHSVTELGPTNQTLFKRVLVRSDKLDYRTLIDHDDTRTAPGAGHHVSRVLRTVFDPLRFAGVEQPPQIWSGICGYTADGKPICGQLSRRWTSRPGQGEWICAGCNGMGLATSWALGELLAYRLLGRTEFIALPYPYSSADERLDSMNVNSFFEEWLPRV